MTYWETVGAFVSILGSIGFWAAIAYLAKWKWNWWKWQEFLEVVQKHVQRLDASGELEALVLGKPKTIDHKAVAGHLLVQAGYGPAECLAYLEVAEAIYRYELQEATRELESAKESFE